MNRGDLTDPNNGRTGAATKESPANRFFPLGMGALYEVQILRSIPGISINVEALRLEPLGWLPGGRVCPRRRRRLLRLCRVVDVCL